MKKLFLIILLVFLIIFGIKKSFFEKAKDVVDESREIIKESSEIIVDYVDTLTGTIQDTKELKDSVELIQNKLQDELNNLK